MNDKEYNLKCEELRELNLPDEIDFLYIGESRPIERDHFFYLPYKPEKNTPPLITIFEKIYTNKTILDSSNNISFAISIPILPETPGTQTLIDIIKLMII